MKIQRGATLIELLVGLLLSSLAVSGMLMTFRNTLQITTSARPAAIQDGERISALLRGHLLIQKAGYGVENPALGTQLLGLNDLRWVTTQDGGTLQTGDTTLGDSLLWSSDTDLDGNLLCEGIVPSAQGGLTYISADCSNAAAWQSVAAWTSAGLLGPPAPGASASVLDVSINGASTCTPVGTGDPSLDMLKGVPASIAITLSTGVSVSGSSCLYNLAPATP